VAAAALLGLASAVAGAAAVTSLPTASERYAQAGEENLRDGDFQAAARDLEKAADEGDGRTATHFNRGLAHMKLAMLGEHREWQKALNAFAQADPTINGKSAACLGYCRLRLKASPRAAAQDFERAIALEFDTPEVRNNLALAQLYDGRYQLAVQTATTAIERNARLPTAFDIRAQAMLGWAAPMKGTLDLAPAVDDLRNHVFAHGPGTRRQYHMAAVLCAMTLQQRGTTRNTLVAGQPKDPHVDYLLEFTRKAVERGHSREQLVKDKLFRDWIGPDGYAPLPAEVPLDLRPAAVGDDRLLDPLRGQME
jgi:tetratricopeptide (TPR) repeat protein